MKKIKALTEDEIEQVSGGAKRRPEKAKPAEQLTEVCPKCGEMKLKYGICTNCGYDGIDIPEEYLPDDE